jgi:hypothetical protein
MKKPILKGYVAIMSNGPDKKIDADEIDAVIEASSTGSFIKVRDGIINPSHIVSIGIDTKRMEAWHDEIRLLRGDELAQKKAIGMMPLKDIFEETPPQLNPATGG